jgi:alpha-beta hydrolase superfamily lysophospholipase
MSVMQWFHVRKLIGASCVALIFSMACPNPSVAGSEPMKNTDISAKQLKPHMKPLKFSAGQRFPSPIMDYFKYYDLVHPDVIHRFGGFDSAGFTLAVHIFIPKQATATVFLLHGYFDHTGTLKHLIRCCVQHRWAVVVFDLPGHGLSSGKRGAIDDFSTYGTVLTDLAVSCKPYLPHPFHVIGHSTGGAVILEHMRQGDVNIFDKIILLAPLIRSAHWHLVKIGYALTKPMKVNRVPRKFRTTSSDPAFLHRLKSDPLTFRKIPIQWVGALFSWHEKMQNRPVMEKDVLIIQGQADHVVGWKYNTAFLKKKISRPVFFFLKKARHQLMNESPDIRKQVCDRIAGYINNH